LTPVLNTVRSAEREKLVIAKVVIQAIANLGAVKPDVLFLFWS